MPSCGGIRAQPEQQTILWSIPPTQSNRRGPIISSGWLAATGWCSAGNSVASPNPDRKLPVPACNSSNLCKPAQVHQYFQQKRPMTCV